MCLHIIDVLADDHTVALMTSLWLWSTQDLHKIKPRAVNIPACHTNWTQWIMKGVGAYNLLKSPPRKRRSPSPPLTRAVPGTAPVSEISRM